MANRAKPLAPFFDGLGPERRASIELASLDMAAGYIKAVEAAVPHATIVFDCFHIARLAQRAVDEVRRAQVRALDPDDRPPVKRTRWALVKNPENLRASEKAKLELVRKTNTALYRAYLLKETFLDLFDYTSQHHARRALDAWTAWARRSRLAPFVAPRAHRPSAPRWHPRLHRVSAHERPTRGDEQQSPSDLPPSLRLPLRRASHRHDLSLCCSRITLPQLQLS
jgi:transposase